MTADSLVGKAAHGKGLTEFLAERAALFDFAAATGDARTVAKQCILDWFGVTVGGRDEAPVLLLQDQLREDGGTGHATVLATGEKLTVGQAALLNGTASHALDYDDVVMVMRAHPTVAILPAALAVGEMTHATGQQILEAFLCGFETACRIGSVVNPSHYDSGWHATSTMGSFGAAAAAGRLLGLDPTGMAHALGLAGTQAAGLRSVFGTMTKPLHAGLAAERGVRAARLAARGFTSSTRIIEIDQGFALTQSRDPDVSRAWIEPPGGYYILQTLFKYHAACYLTHSAIEATRSLAAAHRLAVHQIRRVEVGVDPGHLKICNIQEPRTGTELKFSLRGAVALGLLGEDTSDEKLFSDAVANRDDLVSLRDLVSVEARKKPSHTLSDVAIVLDDGTTQRTSHDTGIPAADFKVQGEALLAKFKALTSDRLGEGASRELGDRCLEFERVTDIGALMRLASARARVAEATDGMHR